jgi:signal transduction histidine kinase
VALIGVEKEEHDVARCRVVLSFTAMLVVYVDPGEPLLARWFHFASGPFTIDPRIFVIMATHLTYSVLVFLGLGRFLSVRLVPYTAWIDLLFAVAITTMTHGVTGPSFPFFAFAIVTGALRGGLRQATMMTAVSLLFYLVVGMLTRAGGADVLIMRPLYLAISGYVVGYLGQQRLELQEDMRQLEVAEQRHRIGRELHDGYAQALAGINLRLEGAVRRLRAGSVDSALHELEELKEGVQREFDDFRRYARTLAGVPDTPSTSAASAAPLLRVAADFTVPLPVADHVLGIAREALSNVRRHARAERAALDIRSKGDEVQVTIEDDGVGFATDVMPWSIASRVRELHGRIEVGARTPTGARVAIVLPTT